MRRIECQRAREDSLRAIAERLNRDGVSTAQGDAQWYAATVRGILVRLPESLAERGMGGLPCESKMRLGPDAGV